MRVSSAGRRRAYLIAAAVLLVGLVLIARYVSGPVIRPFGGDVLVIVFFSCLMCGVTRASMGRCAATAFVTGVIVEVAQALDLIEILGLQDNDVAKTVIGTTFDWRDLVAYVIGAALAVFLDRLIQRR